MQKYILIITGILFALEFYVYQAFKTVTNNNYLRIAYWVITISIYLFFIYEVLNFDRTDRDNSRTQIVASIFLILFLPKLLIIFFLLIEDLGRGVNYIVQTKNITPHFEPDTDKVVCMIDSRTMKIYKIK